jgi:hypothetical protein
LTIHTQGFIDSDEALVGIQAQNILNGQFPIYFYHQPYMGSLEAYIMAIIFAIAGSSVWTMRAEPILLTLVVVWLTWRLAGELADTAKLPLHAKQWFMNIAALLAALPPLYDTVMEMRMLGGYIESFIIMLLLLLCALRLTNRRAQGAVGRELAMRWVGLGFLVGLGFWVNPLTSYAVLAVALWLLWDAIKVLRSDVPAANGAQEGGIRRVTRRVIAPGLAALPACVVGMAPALVWGAANQWQNFTYLFQINGSLRPEITTQYPTRLSMVLGLTKLYTTCLSPRLVGGALPGSGASDSLLSVPMLVLSVICIVTVAALVALSFVRPTAIRGTALVHYRPLLLHTRQLAVLPLVFAVAITVIFCCTSTAAIGLWNCQYDLAGRYATPLMLVLPFFYATCFTMLILLEGVLQEGSTAQRRQVQRQRNLGEQQIYPALMGLMVSFLLLALLFQVGLYGSTDAGSTFQSPYCTFAPTNDDAIIAYMQQEHIHYAWAINWLAFPIDFKTHGSIIVSDPLAIIRNNPSLNRIPAYTDAVLTANRPSFVVIVKHNDPHPLILQMLDVQLVKYNYARFPAQQGRDVLVVTPLNKTVDPTIPDYSNIYFNIFVCSLDS